MSISKSRCSGMVLGYPCVRRAGHFSHCAPADPHGDGPPINAGLCVPVTAGRGEFRVDQGVSGVKGVRKKRPQQSGWVAYICAGARQINLGTFASIDEAVAARAAAEVALWGAAR